MRGGIPLLGVRLAATGLAALLAACDGPIVARGPDALYALAQQQLANSNYGPAADTLARIAREAGGSEAARRAVPLRVALLGGLARSYREIGESYLAGHKAAGDSPDATRLRTTAMDYFSRARGRSLEWIDVLESLNRNNAAGPWTLESSALEGSDAGDALLAQIRQGRWVELDEVGKAERHLVRKELATMAARLAGARSAPGTAELEVSPATFYLGAARELADTLPMFRREAMSDRRLPHLYCDLAGKLVEQARKHGGGGAAGLEAEAGRIESACREALKAR